MLLWWSTMNDNRWFFFMISSLPLGSFALNSTVNWNRWIKEDINFPYLLIGDLVFSTQVQTLGECAVLCSTKNCSMFEMESSTKLCKIYSGLNSANGTSSFPGGPRTVYKREINCELSGYTYKWGLCFSLFVNGRKTWEEASQKCQEEGGRLLIPNSNKKIEAMIEYISGYTYLDYWIGLDDRNVEGTWMWGDGTLLDASNITYDQKFNNLDSTYQPNTNDADCAMLRKTGHFHDSNCNITSKFICEKPQFNNENLEV